MNWNNAVWLYCERGTNTTLLAEPVNAASNIIYLLVVFAALWIYRKLPFAAKSADHRLLMALTFLTGLGSLCFHLFASQWSELAHMLPLLVFMAVYLAIALDRFAQVPAGWTSLIVILFAGVSLAALTMTCTSLDGSLQPPWSMTGAGQGGATSCLNGSVGYIPSMLALFVLAVVLRQKRHKAALSLMLSAVLLSLALVAHALDHLYCETLQTAGHRIGSHFLWHILNGFALFILLRASMVHQNTPTVQEIIPPEPSRKKNL